MLFDLHRDRPEVSATVFDVCIVGGGVAGITLALRLGKAGRRVLLLEAGDREVSGKSQAFYRGEHGELENLPLHETRIRALGGSSNHWGGWCRALDAYDFARSDLLPGGGWPIGEQDLAPYFTEAAALLGITEYSGVDVGVAGADGNFRTIRMHFSKPPANLGANFLDNLQQSTNITLLLNAPCSAIEIDTQRATIKSVSIYDQQTRKPLLCRARQFVLAMGTIENVRHLHILNRKHGNRVGNVGGVLGCYFLQHLHQELGQFVILEGGAAPAPAAHIFAYMASTEQYLRRNGRGAFRLYSTGLTCSGLVDQLRHVIGASCRAATSTGSVFITGEQVPKADSRILLIDDDDELGLPRVKLDWRISDDDRLALREAALEFGRYLVHADIGRFRVNPVILAAAEPLQGWTALAGAPGAAGHHMGGARMSGGSAGGVVDSDCRVWGVDNLYVAGSAVFRTSGHVPPTLTITQLALRLADTLDRKLAR